jgi:hypothetical protein
VPTLWIFKALKIGKNIQGQGNCRSFLEFVPLTKESLKTGMGTLVGKEIFMQASLSQYLSPDPQYSPAERRKKC